MQWGSTRFSLLSQETVSFLQKIFQSDPPGILLKLFHYMVHAEERWIGEVLLTYNCESWFLAKSFGSLVCGITEVIKCFSSLLNMSQLNLSDLV